MRGAHFLPPVRGSPMGGRLPRMSRRLLGFIVPLAFAALFARLGVWQLSRLSERRAFNATLETRLAAPPVDFTAVPSDTGAGHYRRATARGVYLYDREIAWGARTREGSPGVNILTPVRLAGSDTVVMVNRGWAYSEDASTIDYTRWRERDSATVSGYLETYPATDAATNTTKVVHRLDRARIARLVGLPIAPYLLVQTSDSALHADSVPVRMPTPILDEGPHRSYAMQWFSFATIAVVGAVFLLRRTPAA